MNKTLYRVLRQSDIDGKIPPDPQKWEKLLKHLNRAFSALEEDREVFEKALEISSRESRTILESSSRLYEEKIAALLKLIPDVICYMDEDGRYLDILSDGKDELLPRPKEEMLGNRIADIADNELAGKFSKISREALSEKSLKVFNYTVRKDGDTRFCEARIMPSSIKESGKRTLLVIVRDVTAQKRSDEYLNVIKKIFEEATEGIWIASLKESKIIANNSFCRMFGLDCDWISGSTIADYAHFFDPGIFKIVKDSIKSRNFFHGEVFIREKSGKFPVWMIVDTIYNDEGEAVYLVAMLTDISELNASREKLYYTSTHDSLTGLPNRRKLFESIDNSLRRCKRNNQGGALFFLDLDNFKEINDLYGHKAGDDVLRECARRLTRVTRESDVFGRLGGDEFLLIAENINSPKDIIPLAEKILKVVNKPFVVGDLEYILSVSIGVALFPHDSMDRDELLKRSDIAMYQAKQEGKNRYRLYSNTLDRNIKKYYTIENILKRALNKKGFYLLYQPQIELASGRITVLEVLLRIREDIAGDIIMPEEFIPVSEKSDLINKIGKWVFRACCKQLREWKDVDKLNNIVLSINISKRYLIDDKWIVFVKNTIRQYQISADRIEFEITEEALNSSKEKGQKIISQLQEIGFRISIDDFGTGYSSLGVLKVLDINRLKIDKSFIDGVSTNDDDKAIVKASIALGEAFGISTVAEGVETDEQKRIVMELGCHEMQGFLYSVPRGAKEIVALLKSDPASSHF